jgi:hypothetical protein
MVKSQRPWPHVDNVDDADESDETDYSVFWGSFSNWIETLEQEHAASLNWAQESIHLDRIGELSADVEPMSAAELKVLMTNYLVVQSEDTEFYEIALGLTSILAAYWASHSSDISTDERVRATVSAAGAMADRNYIGALAEIRRGLPEERQPEFEFAYGIHDLINAAILFDQAKTREGDSGRFELLNSAREKLEFARSIWGGKFESAKLGSFYRKMSSTISAALLGESLRAREARKPVEPVSVSEDEGLVLKYVSRPIKDGFSSEDWKGMVVHHVVQEMFDGSEEEIAEAATRYGIDYEKFKTGKDADLLASQVYGVAVAKDGFRMDEEDARTISIIWALQGLQTLDEQPRGLSSRDPRDWGHYFHRIAYQWNNSELPFSKNDLSGDFAYHIHSFKELAPLALMAHLTSYWTKLGDRYSHVNWPNYKDVLVEINEAISVVLFELEKTVNAILDDQYEAAAFSALEIGGISERLWKTLAAMDESFEEARFNMPLFPMAAAALFSNAATLCKSEDKARLLGLAREQLSKAKSAKVFSAYLSGIEQDISAMEADLTKQQASAPPPPPPPPATAPMVSKAPPSVPPPSASVTQKPQVNAVKLSPLAVKLWSEVITLEANSSYEYAGKLLRELATYWDEKTKSLIQEDGIRLDKHGRPEKDYAQLFHVAARDLTKVSSYDSLIMSADELDPEMIPYYVRGLSEGELKIVQAFHDVARAHLYEQLSFEAEDDTTSVELNAALVALESAYDRLRDFSTLTEVSNYTISFATAIKDEVEKRIGYRPNTFQFGMQEVQQGSGYKRAKKIPMDFFFRRPPKKSEGGGNKGGTGSLLPPGSLVGPVNGSPGGQGASAAIRGGSAYMGWQRVNISSDINRLAINALYRRPFKVNFSSVISIR